MRVTLAVSLLVTATILVVLALSTQSVLWLSVASVAAILLSWAALRMMWTEVLQSRRENAADRSAAAAADPPHITAPAAAHAAVTTPKTHRLAEAHLGRRELEGRMAVQRTELVAGKQALTVAQDRVQELETLLAVREAEADDALASWEPTSRPKRPRLVKEA